MRLLSLPLFALVFAACAGKDSANDDTAGDTSDTEDTEVIDDSVAPTIVSVDTVSCEEFQSAGESWSIELTVDDPQGSETVRDGSVGVISSEGGELANYVLACGNGKCFGTFRADYDGITCSLLGEVTLRFVVLDTDGNSSETLDHPT